MGICFQWTRRENGKTDDLAFVNDAICSYIGQDPKPGPLYVMDFFAWGGIGYLGHHGGSTIDITKAQAVAEHMVKVNCPMETFPEPLLKRTATWVFTNWQFSAWRD